MKTAKSTIRLLTEFSVAAPELGVSELARRLDLDKATVHRLLRTLAEGGMVEQDATTKRYRLGLAVLGLAAVRLRAFGFLELATEDMTQLRDDLGESVALHVREGYDVVCVQFVEASHPLTVRFVLGERSPIHLTAPGLLHLSEMPDLQWAALVEAAVRANPNLPGETPESLAERIDLARQDLTAVSDQTFQKGVRGMATSIRDMNGAFVGTLSVVAPTSRLSLAELRRRRPDLMTCAQRIGSKLRRM
ncbi:IclR family transcriptional regulator [Lichenifustis flavocetrariae]|uniref:IclR family transcriptional regulator n=1 Tax=Lichenifustis flavocetrariae TaxID=2949735 RepID=A0AA42CLZ0_9HYPH|nr:IclR family transcriptional regulator [Lichenifustis flavocetrariae]MCW6507820.1 IclR family transcriptional regulator [Lichenifustis flavocetrariae]